MNMGKKFIKLQALILAGLMALGLSGCSKKHTAEPITYSISIDKIKTGDNDISLFNVGNFNVKGKSGLKDILKANKKGVPAGAIINTVAENKGEILLDAEYAKYLVENATVDNPIYLDVTGLLENKNLRIDEILDLVSAFCSKLSSNGMFVGVYGSEKDIQKLESEDEANILAAYDVLLKDDDPNIEVNVSSLIKTEGNNSYVTTTNLQQIINNKGLNDKDNFKYDLLYVLSDEDNLLDVAHSFGLSVNDLLVYNGIKSEKNVKKGTKLRIPTRSTISVPKTTIRKADDNSSLLGIDISRYQIDDGVDWETLSNKIQFAILRANRGDSQDSTFEYKAAKCAENNIPMGAYCFNKYYRTDPSSDLGFSTERIDNQTKEFIDSISGKNITLPAYLDFEHEDAGCPINLNDDQVTYLVDNWYDNITRIGLKPGIYTGKNYYRYLKTHYKGEHDIDEDFELWISGDWAYFNNRGIWYLRNNYETSYNRIKEVLDENTLTSDEFTAPDYGLQQADMIQFTACAKGFGIGNSGGFVDVDVTFNNYVEKAIEENVISEKEAELLLVMTPHQKSRVLYEIEKVTETSEFDAGVWAGGIPGLLAGAAIIKILEWRKKRKEETSFHR